MVRPRTLRFALVPLGVFTLLAGFAPAALSQQGDAARGLDIARQVCAHCHVVEEGGRGTDAVPSFRQVATQPGVTEAQLRGFLVDPHPRMPDPQLTNQEVEDLVRYLDSLGQ